MPQPTVQPVPRALILAGPNGAGKTTFAREFLVREAHCPTFLNADLIAAGLSPFAPEKANLAAMRLMAHRMDECFAQRQDFAVESTLAGRTYLNLIRRWRADSYRVKIIFLKLSSPQQAIARVSHRVRLGGHDVPETIIRRRYEQGWVNFQTLYRPLVDFWKVYDATMSPPIIVAQGVRHG